MINQSHPQSPDPLSSAIDLPDSIQNQFFMTSDWQVNRVFIRHRRSENSPSTMQNSPAKFRSFPFYTVLLLLQFLMKNLGKTKKSSNAVDHGSGEEFGDRLTSHPGE